MIVAPVLLLATLVNDEVKLKVSLGDKEAGTANYSQRLTKEGSKVSDVLMTLRQGDSDSTIRMQSWYAPDGTPQRTQMEVRSTKQPRLQVTLIFGTGDVTVVAQAGGDRKTLKVPLPDGSIKQPNEFWFVRDMPVGQSEFEYWSLNPSTLKWQKVVVKYLGQKQVTVGDKVLSSYLISRTEVGGKRVVAYVDNKGLPIKLDDGTITMTRASE